MTTYLTVLQSADGILLTKKHTTTGTESYGSAKWFEFSERQVHSLDDVEELLGELSKQPNKALLIDKFAGEYIAIRAKHKDEPVYHQELQRVRRVREAFQDAKQNLICLDIDSWELGSFDPVRDVENAVNEWITLYLPRSFWGVDYVWQLSSSAGMPGKKGLRVHVWFWLETPVAKESIKSWADALLHDNKASLLDSSMFGRVRVHYTASPVFDGIADPVAVRLGRFCGMVSEAVDITIAERSVVTQSEDEDSDFLLNAVRQPPVGLSVEKARDAVMALDFEEYCNAKGSRPKWIEVGMALHHEFDGKDDGKAIWEEFSKRSELFNQGDLDSAWTSFALGRGGLSKTMASIIKLGKVSGGAFTQCSEKLKGCKNITEAITVVAGYDLTEIEMESVMPLLMAFGGPNGAKLSKGVIKKSIKAEKSELDGSNQARAMVSLEDWIAEETLRVRYKGGKHLLRHAKQFWHFRSGVWSVISDETIGGVICKIIGQIAQGTDNPQLAAALKDSGRNDTLNALSNAICGILGKKLAEGGVKDPMRLASHAKESIMNCTNGELVFTAGHDRGADGQFKVRTEFRDHNPESRLTCQFSTEYDPDATCPLWDRAIAKLLGGAKDSEETIRHLYEVMGYILQTKRSLATWVMFYGSGSNGKSMISSTLQSIMGEDAIVRKELSKLGTSGNAHMEAGLIGKMLLVDDDFEKGAMLPDGMLKKLSEEKGMTANPKFAGEVNFISRAVPLILTNSWPKTVDNSYGMTRRAQIFWFKNTISDEETDHTLQGRIRDKELAGILNHLIAGWERVLKRGCFKQSESCKEALDVWKGKRNTLAGFLTERLTVTGVASDRVSAKQLWDEFQGWVQEENAGLKMGRHTFYDEIATAKGVSRQMRGGALWFRGLKINLPADPFEVAGDDLV